MTKILPWKNHYNVNDQTWNLFGVNLSLANRLSH